MTGPDEREEALRALRETAIRSLAAGLDIPPDILAQDGLSRHWSEWDRDEAERFRAIFRLAVTTDPMWWSSCGCGAAHHASAQRRGRHGGLMKMGGMVNGMFVRVDPIVDPPYLEPVTAEKCAKCDRPNPDLAHSVFEYVAATLAEPLRRAFVAHLDEHGCAKRGGFAYCDEAMRLFGQQPIGDQIIVG